MLNVGMYQLFFAVCCMLAAGCNTGNVGIGDYRYLQYAEELSRQKRYNEAIKAYQEHMNYRLSLNDRPEWENPYFYLILIGDIYLSQDQIEKALGAYLQAEKQGVDRYLVADRIRSAARWYENNDRLEEALELLSRHRQADELLFDSMLDRISKELVRREDALNKP